MKISLIAAVSQNGVIGYQNRLPWHIPEDLKRFKKLTMEHHIIMGRKTYDSISKPLEGRISVILSRSLSSKGGKNCVFLNSLAQAIEYCFQKKEDEAFLIGGESIFREALESSLPDKIYLTKIHQKYQGDVFFPNIDIKKYRIKNIEDKKEYSFVDYERVR